jgi:hemerythrin superfamily protein
MDAITLLKADHQTVEQLFKRFEQAGDRAHVQKRDIVDRIIEELSVHAAIEEQVFYPAAREAVPETNDIALESLEEHHIVKWVLSELVGMDPAHERFDAKVTVLIENVRHHVKEEESDFFPKVRAQMGRNELADLGQALADAKKTAPRKPHPLMPDTPPANLVAGTLTGLVDKVGSNLSGLAKGGVNVAQDLLERVTGSDEPTKRRNQTKPASR